MVFSKKSDDKKDVGTVAATKQNKHLTRMIKHFNVFICFSYGVFMNGVKNKQSTA